MPRVINATEETISIKLCGNYFTFKPGASKNMKPELANFIQMDRRDSGLAVVPDLFGEDVDMAEMSDEQVQARKDELKEIEATAKEEALRAYLQKYRQVIANNTIHLRRDLEQANIKAAPESFVSDGELEAMRIVSRYQKKDEDKDQLRADEARKLIEKINKGK